MTVSRLKLCAEPNKITKLNQIQLFFQFLDFACLIVYLDKTETNINGTFSDV